MPDEPYKYFRIEAREIVEHLGQGVLDIEKGKSNPDLIARLLRLAHTLKGAARVVKQSEIADQAHTIEDELEPYREKTGFVPKETVDALLRIIDRISRRVAALVHSPETNGASSSVQTEDVIRTVRFDHTEIDELLHGLAEAYAQIGLLRNAAAPYEKVRHLVEQLDRELRQVRETAERMRLIPVGSLFTYLERSARDAARMQGKQVTFEGYGGEFRVAADVLTAIQSALLQLVRNAVAHGIELPNDRKSAGKPVEGRICLDVVPFGRRVAFRCRDDGRGIDRQAIRQAAGRKGLSLLETQNMGPEAIFQMLLKGGISTSAIVTEVSGRGIGLTVVREVVDRLGGEVTFQTEPGRGVTVEIVVPLSVSSVESLLVEASGTTAAIPLYAVRNIIRITPDALTQTPSGETILFNDRPVPFRRLACLLSPGPIQAGPLRSCSGIILEGQQGVAALGVDRLNGTSNIVLRPLPEFATASPIVAGVSLNADGIPQLVLDPGALVEETQRASSAQSEDQAVQLPVLVIDDSLTTRMLEQSILESAGYEVDVAVSGEEGLEKARQKKYGLFLVDIEMPGIDGFTFIERACADPMLRDVPSILVTSRESSKDRKRGEEVGARDYVAKSEFNQEQLLRRIRELVS